MTFPINSECLPCIGGISEFKTNPASTLIDQIGFLLWLYVTVASHVWSRTRPADLPTLPNVHCCPSCTLKICLGGKKRAFSRLVRRKMNLSVTWETSESISWHWKSTKGGVEGWDGIQKVGKVESTKLLRQETFNIHPIPFLLCVFCICTTKGLLHEQFLRRCCCLWALFYYKFESPKSGYQDHGTARGTVHCPLAPFKKKKNCKELVLKQLCLFPSKLLHISSLFLAFVHNITYIHHSFDTACHNTNHD